MKPIRYALWQIGPGGLELVVKQYSEHFHRTRELHVYGLRPTWIQIYDESKIEVRAGDSGKLRPYLQYFRYCRRHRHDVFHLQSVGPLVLLLTLLAGVKSVVYHIHGTIYWKNPLQKIYLRAGWRLVKKMLPHVKSSFVANSKYSAAIFNEKAMPVQPQVVYNGFDVQRFATKKSLRTSLRKIGYAGRIWPGKNVDMVVRLFEEIAPAHPELELHIAGDGTLFKDLQEQVRQSPFTDRIHLLGHVKDIPAFYASMDLFLFLSSYESFGNVIAEALLTGLPTLTSDLPVFKEIYGDDTPFALGAPSNYDEIKRNFLTIIEDFPRLARKAYELSASIEAQCSIENHLRQIEKVYEKH